MISCSTVKDKYDLKASCCGSCHEDEEYGYALLEANINGERGYVCCSIYGALEGKGILDAE